MPPPTNRDSSTSSKIRACSMSPDAGRITSVPSTITLAETVTVVSVSGSNTHVSPGGTVKPSGRWTSPESTLDCGSVTPTGVVLDEGSGAGEGLGAGWHATKTAATQIPHDHRIGPLPVASLTLPELGGGRRPSGPGSHSRPGRTASSSAGCTLGSPPQRPTIRYPTRTHALRRHRTDHRHHCRSGSAPAPGTPPSDHESHDRPGRTANSSADCTHGSHPPSPNDRYHPRTRSRCHRRTRSHHRRRCNPTHAPGTPPSDHESRNRPGRTDH